MSGEPLAKKRVALLDWDGTLRKDFTIRSWIKFLASHAVVSEKIIEDIEEIFTFLFKKDISHDEASFRTSRIYASYLKGCSKLQIAELAALFVKEDYRHFCSFASTLLSYLARINIQTIIVSGAPIEILKEYQYQYKLPVGKIYAFALQAINGVYRDKVIANYGTAKEKWNVVNRLLSTKKYHIVLSAGNSLSDQPLFEVSPLNIIVDNSELRTKNKSLHLYCDDADNDKLFKFLNMEMSHGG